MHILLNKRETRFLTQILSLSICETFNKSLCLTFFQWLYARFQWWVRGRLGMSMLSSHVLYFLYLLSKTECPPHAIWQKKPDTRVCIVYNSFYIKIRGKINHNQIVVSWARGKEVGRQLMTGRSMRRGMGTGFTDVSSF